MGQDLATRLKTKVETLIARSEALDRDNAELKARLARCETENEKKDKELLSSLEASPRGGLEGVSFHMYPDQDAPGERLFLQLQKVLPTLVHHQLPEGCKDYGEYYSTPPLSPPRGRV